jgi:hypothetical protein
VFEIGMADGGSEQRRTTDEGCEMDKALGNKGLRVDSERHKSCTRGGCRVSTARE